ncbi:2Fe-2S iron-sulfur cluster-binding protein [Segniliparus rugosus]|uniref:2Fe-2S ferredoxin-type domain-containing protein n=1 Tax=Segniliparus rugosus (strain ATCC BAA-974 / DSM 45345 / CCUG 50838 / CIP 108380 / JCM 13579 / CDC 945) TaxID=679197 RepID=E5XSK9_SEGRC|nr:2Fe-2S iron-sulfur cluster binding domain-containing protein [Segniliparus rugosus]EFV12686.2 hypothetical protein HMPREF9336_02481 [Segniliparus rugosus ATCC BAA-974]
MPRFRLRRPEPAPAASSEGRFEVELRRSGRTVAVPPGVTVLDAIRARGVEIESMCRSGICGSCQTRVLAGRVEHRDGFLTEEERERFMTPCVSRAPAGERIVLDL